MAGKGPQTVYAEWLKNEEIYFSGSISAIKADLLGQEFCFFFTDSLFMM